MKKNYRSVKSFLFFASIAAYLPLTSCNGGSNQTNNDALVDGKYNVIFITTDQEAYMASYPSESNYEARERLRRIGTSFEKHYACSNVSTSSRSTIYTGRHITETKMLDNTNMAYQPDMDTEIKTVGDMMREAGYYTAYKGKWHISRHENSLEDYGFADWTEGNIYGSIWEGYESDGLIADRSCEWLENKGMELNAAGQPFFLAVNFINPHDIMYFGNGTDTNATMGSAPAPDAEVYKTTYPSVSVPTSWNESLTKDGRPTAHYEYNYAWEQVVGKTPATESEWHDFSDYYYNCIQDCDKYLLQLLNQIDSLGLMENTIIVFTSDHGEMLGSHGLKGKGGNIYENNIHVPLIVYHPEYPGGRSCKNITSHIDLVPTFVDIATNNEADATRIKAGIKGHSLMPAVEEPETDIRNSEGALFVYDMISMFDKDAIVTVVGSETTIKADLTKRGWLRGIITPEYKFARYFSPLQFNTPIDVDSLYANNDVELYGIGTDECDNLAWPKDRNETLTMLYNGKLNDLISREIGEDDGSEKSAFVGGIMNYAK